jgi:hypothetical protein
MDDDTIINQPLMISPRTTVARNPARRQSIDRRSCFFLLRETTGSTPAATRSSVGIETVNRFELRRMPDGSCCLGFACDFDTGMCEPCIPLGDSCEGRIGDLCYAFLMVSPIVAVAVKSAVHPPMHRVPKTLSAASPTVDASKVQTATRSSPLAAGPMPLAHSISIAAVRALYLVATYNTIFIFKKMVKAIQSDCIYTDF